MNKPGVLLVGNFLSSYIGTRSMGEELSLHLSKRGWRVIETSRQRQRFFRLVDMLASVISYRKKYQISYIEVYSGLAFFWAELVCLILTLLQKPYVLTLHGGNLPNFAGHWPERVKRLLKGAMVVTAPSRYLQEQMGSYCENIVLIPNPLDIEKYAFRLRSKPGLHLIWLRAFHKIYNPQMAPLVVASLHASYPEVTLTMIGPDKGDGSFQETQEIIEKLGLKNNIKIIPGVPKSQIPFYLEQADIFINTTNIDNTPVTVLEAMACGLCIVSTNVGGLPYLLDDGQDAVLVPPNDPKAMASAVKYIFTESGLIGRLSYNARKKAEQFDWLEILPQWEKTFIKMMG